MRVRHTYREHATTIQLLWFLLALKARGSPALVVKRFETNDDPSGEEARMKLEIIYGGNQMDERRAQLLALEGRLRDIRYDNVILIRDFLVRLDTIRAEFYPLGMPRTDETKRAAFFFGIKDTLPHIFVQLSTRPGTDHDEVKWSIIASSTYLGTDTEGNEYSIILQSQARGNARRKTKLGTDQCAYRLKRNHRWWECRKYLSRKLLV